MEVLSDFPKKRKNRGGVPIDHGIIETKGSTLMAKANEDVQLIVLSDHITFSSATMLCVWVRDGKLGKIVGEPSTNKPNSYGDILMLTDLPIGLPASGLQEALFPPVAVQHGGICHPGGLCPSQAIN